MTRHEALSEFRRLALGLDSEGRRCGGGLDSDSAEGVIRHQKGQGPSLGSRKPTAGRSC